MSVNANTVSQLKSSLNKLIDSNNGLIKGNKIDDLETLFEEIQYFNAGEAGSKQIEDQIAKFEEAIKTLKESIEKITEHIEEKQGQISKKGDKVSEIVSNINKSTTEYQDKYKQAAKGAWDEAWSNASKANQPFAVAYEQALGKAGLAPLRNKIKNMYGDLDSSNNEFSGLFDGVDADIKELNSLGDQLRNTNGTINLLNQVKNGMSETLKAAYQNCDTDAYTPIFSGKKAEVADEILAAYQSRYTNESEFAGTGASNWKNNPVAQEFQEKAKQAAPPTPGVDIYSSQSNGAFENLNNLINNEGMLTKLRDSGMSIDDIMGFVSENWTIGLSRDNNGTGNWVIPIGHSPDAVKVYDQLSNFVTNSDKRSTVSAGGVNQTQLAELNKAVYNGKILEKMYNAGFTFKEAMYTLTKAFPDAGIQYDISAQGSKGGSTLGDTRNYGLAKDNEKSGTLYADISKKILDYWNVGDPSDIIKEDNSAGVVSERNDPITFQKGDKTYTFITDRNNDGKFDYTDGKNNELLGSKNGISELMTYDTDGNGVISGKELDSMMLMSNRQIESVGENGSKDVDEYKKGGNYKNNTPFTNVVDFDISYASASDLGITSIDLSELLKNQDKGTTGKGDSISDTTKKYDNVQEAYDDINGSSVINTFAIKMNDGSTVNAKETLNTEENLETFYGQVANGKNGNEKIYTDKISKNDFNKAMGDTSSINDLLEQIENAKDKAKDLDYDDDDPEDMLNMSRNEFETLYGDGYGSYIYEARMVANSVAEDGQEAIDDALTDFNKKWNKKNKLKTNKN